MLRLLTLDFTGCHMRCPVVLASRLLEGVMVTPVPGSAKLWLHGRRESCLASLQSNSGSEKVGGSTSGLPASDACRRTRKCGEVSKVELLRGFAYDRR